jgi:hypothetical protein
VIRMIGVIRMNQMKERLEGVPKVAGWLACLLIMAVALPGVAAADDDAFTVTVADRVVTVLHEYAEYNCCMDYAEYAVAVAEQVIEVVESEVTAVPCYCLCFFDLTVAIADVPPGDYTLLFRWLDQGDTELSEVALPVIVPDVGQGDEAVVDSTEMSDCYWEMTAVPEPEDEVPEDDSPVAATWSVLKATYR